MLYFTLILTFIVHVDINLLAVVFFTVFLGALLSPTVDQWNSMKPTTKCESCCSCAKRWPTRKNTELLVVTNSTGLMFCLLTDSIYRPVVSALHHWFDLLLYSMLLKSQTRSISIKQTALSLMHEVILLRNEGDTMLKVMDFIYIHIQVHFKSLKVHFHT